MKYFIDNIENEYDQVSFDNLLYDACRCYTIDHQKEIIPKYTGFKEEMHFHSGVIMKAIQTFYKATVKKLNEDKEVSIGDVKFFTKEDDK